MMGSHSPATSKMRKDSPSSSFSSKVGPHRRTSSVASSCVSLELGDADVQSPARSNGPGNGLGKSPATSMASSPHTPAGLEKTGSPSALKKRRASIGGSDDLARGLDFGSTTSPSTEEKKHPFLTRGGGHKKVVTPAMQPTISPAKKPTSTATPAGKEKLLTTRSTPSMHSPRKAVEARKDIISPRRSVLASEGSSTNGSLVSEATSGQAEVTSKKISPRASLDSKVSLMKPSPRPTLKSLAARKGRTNSNGDVSAESPLEADSKFSSGKSLDRKTSDPKILDAKTSDPKTSDAKAKIGKSPDVKTKKLSPVASLKFRPGLTSPKSQKLALSRKESPSQSGRAKPKIEKAVRKEEFPKPELNSVPLPELPETENQAKSEDVKVAKLDEASTFLPSLTGTSNVGDEDTSSLDHGGEPGFENDMDMDMDMDMPTSWLSEDLPCMFSSLSRLPEPDDSRSSHLGDPLELLDEQEIDNHPHEVKVAAEVAPRGFIATQVEDFAAPREISNEAADDEYDTRSFTLDEDALEAEQGHAHEDEFESQRASSFSMSESVSHDETMPYVAGSHPLSDEIATSNKGLVPVNEGVAREGTLTEERSTVQLFEGRSGQASCSFSDEEEPMDVEPQFPGERILQGNGVSHLDKPPHQNLPEGISALHEEDRWPEADEDEMSASQDQVEIESSDDESSEDYIEGSCGAQLNLKQSFDEAAEPSVSHNNVDEKDEFLSRDSGDVALPTERELVPEVTNVAAFKFGEQAQNGQEPGTHVDKDMMIFDFEEYWTQNAGDESCQSDAGQNDAEDLQHSYFHREEHLQSPVEEEAAKLTVPCIELPVSSLPRGESIDLEPQSSAQLGDAQLDSQGWPRPHSPSKMDTESSHHEDVDEEVFHVFEGSYGMSPKADSLSSLEKPTVELHQEPLAPVLSVADASDSISSPKFNPLKTELHNGVEINQMDRISDVHEERDVELTEHQNSSVPKDLEQDASVADYSLPKPGFTDRNPVDEEPLAQETHDAAPLPTVSSNGANIQHFDPSDDDDDPSDESMDFEGPEESEYSDITQVSAPKSSFDAPILSDDSLDTATENLSKPQVLQVPTTNAQSAETADDRDAESLPDEGQNSRSRYVASAVTGADDLQDITDQEMLSSKDLKVERADCSLVSNAGAKVDPFEVDPLEIDPSNLNAAPISSLPVSEEEQTEAIFLMSLASKEEKAHNKDSSTDQELQMEEPRVQDETMKDQDSANPVGDKNFQDWSAESGEAETGVPEHESLQIQSRSIFPRVEKPQDMQSLEDERMITPVLQMEADGESVDMSHADQQPQMEFTSSRGAETVQSENETLHNEQGLPAAGSLNESNVSESARSIPENGQEDDMLKENFDSESEVESTASIPEVQDDAAHSVITTSGATVTDTASNAEIIKKDEAIHSTAAAPTPVLPPEKLSISTLHDNELEAGEFDYEIGSEGAVDKERWRVGGFGEESSWEEHGWEEPLQDGDQCGTKLSPKEKRDLLCGESKDTSAVKSVMADDTEDFDVDLKESEESSSIPSTPVPTLNETVELQDHDFDHDHDSSHIPLGKSPSSNHEDSRTEAALEKEKDSVPSLDATYDHSDDHHAFKAVEIPPEYSAEDLSSQDVQLERIVAPNQHVLSAATSDVDEEDSESKEGQNTSETLKPMPPLKDENTVGDSPNMSFIHFSQDTVRSEDLEDSTAPPVTSLREMYATDTFAAPQVSLPSGMYATDTAAAPQISVPPDVYVTSTVSPDDRELEEKETVVYSPKNSFVASDAAVLDAADDGTHSQGSRTLFKEEEGNNGKIDEDSLPNDEIANLSTTSVDSQGVYPSSWRDENEAVPLVEEPLHKDEGVVITSPKEFSVAPEEFSVASGEFSDVEEVEEHGRNIRKEEEKRLSLNGSLERGDEEAQVVNSAKSELNVPTEEVGYDQYHSDDSNGESFNGSLKEAALVEDEEKVVYRPTLEEFSEEESSPKGIEKLEGSHVDTFNGPEQTVESKLKPTEEELILEGSLPEDEEKVAESHVEISNDKDHGTENAAVLEVEEQENDKIFNGTDHAIESAAALEVKEHENDKEEGEKLRGSIEQEFKPEIENSSKESYDAPDVLGANYASSTAAAVVLEKATEKEEENFDQRLEGNFTSEVEQTVVESSEQPFVARDSLNANPTSKHVAVEEFENLSDREEPEAFELDPSPDKEPMFEAEETFDSSSEKESGSESESFPAPELVNANYTPNEVVPENLEKQHDAKEETLDRTLKAESTEVEDEETLDRSRQAESMNGEDEETAVESSKEAFTPALRDANSASNLVVQDELEILADKEEATSDEFQEAKSTFEVDQGEDSDNATTQFFVAPDEPVIPETASDIESATEDLKKQSDPKQSNFEEKNLLLEVPDKVEKNSKESTDISGAGAESPDAEDLDKRPAELAHNNDEDLSLHEINLEEESFQQDTTVDSSSEKPGRLTEATGATESLRDSSGDVEANVVPSNSNLADEDAREPQDAPHIADDFRDDVQADSVSKSLQLPEVAQTDTNAEDMDGFSEAPAVPVDETCMTNGDKNLEDANTTVHETAKRHDFMASPTAETRDMNASPTPETQDISASPTAETQDISASPTAETHDGIVLPTAETQDSVASPTAKTQDIVASPTAETQDTSALSTAKTQDIVASPTTKIRDIIASPASDTCPDSPEPESPVATLFPLSRPPFSGSQQDRLWEEQAEAYNSGQGTPSRNDDHATSAGSPKPKAEDQIQPVAGATSNGNHAVLPAKGASNHENESTPVRDQLVEGNGKEKLHTPLRSLLLEECSHGGSITPNGVSSSSPSFIRRLFRVMSTSRSVEKDTSQTKLKRSSSMWVSCLGSPQVQQ